MKEQPYGIAPMLVYATRYALGRRSGAASDVEYAVAANLDAVRRDAGCREAMIRDIEEARDGDTRSLGDAVDRECWMRTLGRLQAARLYSTTTAEPSPSSAVACPESLGGGVESGTTPA